VRSYVRPLDAVIPAGHDEFRGAGVTDQFFALLRAVSQADCPMSGFRPSWLITRSAPCAGPAIFRRKLLRLADHCWNRLSVDAAFRQERPDYPSHFIGQGDCDNFERLAREEAQSGNFNPRFPNLIIDVAPMIRSVLSCSLPRFEMEPSRSLPPLE
jgi:hypothetical protein